MHVPVTASTIGPKLKFKQIKTIKQFVQVLEDSFGFRWEPWGRQNSPSNMIVYWPVRLRKPTPIHAVQCFAVAGLQRLGAKVVLCLDNLGSCNAEPRLFLKRAGHWLKMAGGNPGKLQTYLFSQIVTPENARRVWENVQTWLGRTGYKLDMVLRISKYEDATSLEALCQHRPRRLLTPALVWACLGHIRRKYPDHSILTLGGHDEKDLWEAWRNLIQVPRGHTGHLYGFAQTEWWLAFERKRS